MATITAGGIPGDVLDWAAPMFCALAAFRGPAVGMQAFVS